jgi:hypothetical protein
VPGVERPQEIYSKIDLIFKWIKILRIMKEIREKRESKLCFASISLIQKQN